MNKKMITARVITLLSGMIIAMIMIILPLGYFLYDYYHEIGGLDTETMIYGHLLTKFISSSPDTWEFEEARLSEFILKQSVGEYSETLRILNLKNEVVAEKTTKLLPPVIMRSSDLMDSGVFAGKIEIYHSIRHIIVRTGILFLCLLPCGLGAFIGFCVFPIRMINKAQKELQKAHDDLDRKARERAAELLEFNSSLQAEIIERRRSEEFIKNILKSMGEGLIVIDHGNRIVSSNRAFCEQVKMPVEDIVGNYCYKIARHKDRPCYDEGEECPAKHTFETGEPHSVQRMHLDKEGNFLNVEVKSYPMKNTEGKIVSVIEIISDITDRNKLQAQLLHAQKMEVTGQLAGGIAHDFNNVLSAIVGYGYVTLMKMAEDDPLRLNIEYMLEAANRAAQLTQSLLAFSRKQITDRKPVDLNECMRTVGKLLNRVIGEDIEVKMVLHESAINILADSGQIEQVLMNLATNARDAMPEGGSLIIETALTVLDRGYITAYGYGKRGTYALLSVTDTGVGMNEATRKRIFEPFFTTKEVGKGTGLGLAMVYGIIKQHDGFINVYSEPGMGTTFKIYLPVIASGTAGGEKAQETECPRGGTETILLAEDDESFRKLTTTVLREFGYEVIEAVDGEDTVKKFMENKERIQLLLFDLVMPKMTGKEAYDEIKKITPDIKIIFSSGYPLHLLRQRMLLENDMPVISKPISPADLLKKVRSVLNEEKT